MRYTRLHGPHGLSVVELIIILAIIGLLIGLLLPMVSKIRERARITACASNLRQIDVGLQAYRTNNRNHKPNARYMPEPFSHDPPTAMPLFKCLASYLPQSSAVYRCPGDIGQVYNRCSDLSPERLGISYFYAAWSENLGRKNPVLLWCYEGADYQLIEPPLHPRHGNNALYLDSSVSYGEQPQ